MLQIDAPISPGRPEKLVADGWLAVATRSRFEKTVHAQLQQKNIESFLPLRRVLKRWSDRKQLVEEPVFRGYVFVHPSEPEQLRVLKTTGVVRFVGPKASAPWVIPAPEMTALRRFIENDLTIDPYPFLREGLRVRVVRGPLKDVEGFIVRKPRFCRLVISIEMMMQSAAVELDESDVEPV